MKRRSTRDRVLETCLKLFNARGPAAVTTAEIAEAVNINQGNLYYYFKKKADILETLFDRFADRQLAMAEQDVDLHSWFSLMWEWRFFYRDSVAVFTLAPSLRERLQTLSDRVQQRNRATLRAMVRLGYLKASEDEIERLLVNAWIVSTYWLEYLHSRHGITRLTKKHIEWGYQQMEALFQPYLTGPWPGAEQMQERSTNTES